MELPCKEESQKRLDEAWKLKQQAYKIEEEVAKPYRHKVKELCDQKKFNDAIRCINSLDWHECIEKFDLFSLLRALQEEHENKK